MTDKRWNGIKSASPRELLGRIEQNEDQGGGLFVLHLSLESDLGDAKGGNFLMLSVQGESEIILRRPMAIYDLTVKDSRQILSVLYSVVGRGTQRLSKLKKGAELSLLGPIGNAFPDGTEDQMTWVVAGGIGIAPFLYWSRLQAESIRAQCNYFFGFRKREQSAIVKDFTAQGVSVQIATQEPSQFFQGTSVDLFKEALETSKPDMVFTCGPTPMMERVISISKDLRIPCFASLEAKMACGVGVCLSCVTDFSHDRSAGKYSLVCQDGPVFRAL
jgi:dihydroorotate dehydrogenase electron transfer subunit